MNWEINNTSNTGNSSYNLSSNNSQQGNFNNLNTIWAEFSDDNETVDISDVTYTQDKKVSAEITAFLENHKGESWTNTLKFEITKLIMNFNFECKKAEMFGEDTNTQNITAQKPTKAPNTGETVSVRREDGVRFAINVNNNTITQYDKEGKLVNERSMTPEEKNLSTQELLETLYNSKDTQEIKSNKQEPASGQRTLNAPGINGTYQLIEKGDGYTIGGNVSISVNNNPVAQLFLEGFDSINTQNGYSFRGITGHNLNDLRQRVRIRAQILARDTAIYNDLQTKVKNGEKLNGIEDKFIEDYKTSLTKYGLKINDRGEIESQ